MRILLLSKVTAYIIPRSYKLAKRVEPNGILTAWGNKFDNFRGNTLKKKGYSLPTLCCTSKSVNIDMEGLGSNWINTNLLKKFVAWGLLGSTIYWLRSLSVMIFATFFLSFLGNSVSDALSVLYVKVGFCLYL